MRIILLLTIFLVGCANNMTYEQRVALLAVAEGLKHTGHSMRGRSLARRAQTVYVIPQYHNPANVVSPMPPIPMEGAPPPVLIPTNY